MYYQLLATSEIFSNGYLTGSLDIINITALLCGILVIINKNPIVSVIFLIGLFITILVNFTIFQILPYYMAILNNYSSKLNTILYYIPWNKFSDILNYINKNIDITNANIMFVSSNSWDNNMAETGHTATIGHILYTSHNMWIFMASFILLLAMTGAIIITIKNEKANEAMSGVK